MKQYTLPSILLLFTSLLFFSCREEQIVPVEIDVVFHIRNDNHTAPLEVYIENDTKEAKSYLWTFEGGEPATSRDENPSVVVFRTPGEHLISLEAWNEGDRKTYTQIIRVDSMVVAGFTTEVLANNYAPAEIIINNLSTGGTLYQWTFEGGIPSVYEGKNPPHITYPNEGTYLITLSVENGSSTFHAEQQIEVMPALDGDFEIIPSFEDEDMEAPLRATFDVRLQGVETVLFTTEGGDINNAASTDASVFYPNPGIFVVTMTIGNGKETKQITQSIIVKPNNNLRTHSDIMLGINTAQETIGSCYSTKLRRMVKSQEIVTVDPAMIDIVYMGLNSNFSLNRFVSPDSALYTPLKPIQGGLHTKFINKQEEGNIYITPEQFIDMTNDDLIRRISISALDYGWEPFEAIPIPRVVLFETADRRKGAIYIKKLISAEKDNSYILVDIKIQKND